MTKSERFKKKRKDSAEQNLKNNLQENRNETLYEIKMHFNEII